MMRRKKTTEKGQDLNQYKIGDVVCANIKGYPDGWPGVVRRVSTDNIIVYFKSDDDEFTFNRKKVKPFHLNETKMNETARKIKDSQMRDMFIQDCEWARRKMRPSIVICPSGLTNDKKKNILELCCNNSSKMSEVFTEDVTHVVIKTDPEGSRICDRTLKFFKSIAKKCWLLDYQWIVDSVSAGHLLPEEDFEVIGDTVTEKKHYGPKISRLAESPLLKDYQIYFYGRTCDISKDDLEDLATSCGGSLLDSAKRLTPESRQLAVACVDEFTSDYDKKQVTTMTMGLQTVSHDWLLDSITVFQVQDLTEYLITDKEHQTGDSEMNETEEKQNRDNAEVTLKKEALSMSGIKTKGKESIDIGNNNADFVSQDGHTDEKNDPDFLPDPNDKTLDTDHDEVNLKKEALSMSGMKTKGKESIDICNNNTDFVSQDGHTDEKNDPDFLPDSDDEMLDTDHDEVNIKREALSMSGMKDKGKDSIGCCSSDGDFGGQDDDTYEINDPDFLPDSDDEMLDTDHDEVNIKREALSISKSKTKDNKRKRTDDCNSDGKSKVMVSDSDSNPESEVFPMLNSKQGKKKQNSGVKVQMAHNGNKRKWDKKTLLYVLW
ncbi:uncharacterized protein [Argopecten irradians]|uniref:uncharacterized protein n=1 Tax=Argopecten irradians TaxID=31199 RepID=UPI00371B57CE